MTEPRTSDEAGRAILPLDLSDLPRLTRAEAALGATLARHRADPATARAWLLDFRSELERVQGASRTLTHDELCRVHQFGLASECVDPFGARLRVRLFLRLGRGDAALELDLGATRAVLAAMIGVEADAFARSDLLTQLEEGALAHIIDLLGTRTLAAKAKGPVHLRGIGTESAALPWPPAETLALIGDAAIADTRLAFRLLLPRATLDGASVGAMAALSGLGLADLAINFAGDVGHATLGPGEFAGLERADIVILDAAGIGYEEGALAGEVLFRAEGVGDGPGFRARLADGGARGEVLALVRRAAEAAEEVMMQGTEGAASGEALLPELPVRLRVEMGRVQLTVAQLSALNVGAIVELHREPKAPVSLWVEDRRIGAGELVSVDGQLGVRITELG